MYDIMILCDVDDCGEILPVLVLYIYICIVPIISSYLVTICTYILLESFILCPYYCQSCPVNDDVRITARIELILLYLFSTKILLMLVTVMKVK